MLNRRGAVRFFGPWLLSSKSRRRAFFGAAR
jgi:hypothetical protein